MPLFKMASRGLTPKSNQKSRNQSPQPANNRTVPQVCLTNDDASEAGSADLVGAVGGLDTSEIDAISSNYSSSSENLSRSNTGQPVDRLATKRKSKTLTFGRKKNDKTKLDSSKKQGKFWTIRKKFPVRLRIGKQHGLPEPTVPIDTSSCICTEYKRTEDHVLGPGIVFAAARSSNKCGATASPLQPSSLRTTRMAMGAGPGPTGIGCLTNPHWLQQLVPAPLTLGPTVIDLSPFNPDEYPTEDVDEMLIAQRARDMEMGVEVSPSHIAYPNLKYSSSTSSSSASSSSGSSTASSDHIWNLTSSFHNQCVVTTTYPVMDRRQSFSRESHVNDFSGFSMPGSFINRTVHTQVDYIHCLVPDLLPITNCCFYWGVMDRYEAEKLLESKPEGSFLLRDSAQEEFLFSVSFRRYGRSLHARIEQWNHRFSFDSHDPGVFASDSVCGLIEHYKDPSCCMFFEPMLTKPVNRTFPFSLQHQCRATVCKLVDYDGVHYLPLPNSLKEYLRYYHYKQKVRVRRFEMQT